ncbi:ketosteroid isomerase-like protein [Herbaspirillum sp. Sphag1AN]|uniref:nuclear transport factor 2 family protein n=1 Tax=unclassified Herbaspirillum TaxID=2624150 RepID=UPI001611FB10|nr:MULTISPECIES: nuclear transport factor 2 family protein [unclassified Herbaspirillum]MBB3212337.1 ketosteroid isomerase-like protein [Herbaspirillum sp. Sphag1AN]MBB3245565.1 ketosteroid isomerase-like protein [Herbaspirillum sp. Sphag64]
MHPNAELITTFYQAFQKLDAETMAHCYATDIVFSDPVFPKLHAQEAGDMWRMLTSKAQDFSLTFDGIEADDLQGKAHWVATYTFSQSGNRVVNDIQARFVFKDGKIIGHTDTFDFWTWARQALGLKGALLGWSKPLRNAVQAQAAKGLKAFRAKRQ